MGLAATQARYLFITSRQLDVSAKMQSNSMQSLKLASAEQNALETYQSMLDGTSSLYDGVVSFGYTNQDFKSLMKDNHHITDAESGALVLSHIPTENGYGTRTSNSSPTSASPKLLDIAGDDLFISPSELLSAGVTNAKTFAEKILGKTGINFNTPTSISVNSMIGSSMNDTSLSKLVKPITGWQDTADAADSLGRAKYQKSHTAYENNQSYTLNNPGIDSIWVQATTNNKNWGLGYKTLGEIYKKAGTPESFMYLCTMNTSQKKNTGGLLSADIANIQIALDGIATGISNTLLNNLTENGFDKAEVTRIINSVAASQNTKFMNNIVSTSNEWKNITGDGDDCWWNEEADAFGKALFKYSNSADILACFAKNINDDNGFEVAMDMGKYLKEFIDSVLYELTGGECNKNDLGRDIGYVYGNTYNKFNVAEKYQKCSDERSAIEAMFAVAQAKGIQLSNNITDKDYLTTRFANGMSGGYLLDNQVFSNTKLALEQGTKYMDDLSPEEVAAIERKAEQYYDSEMARIQKKEKFLDMEMTKLQTEYQALETDMNSVKTLLQTNVSKSFTYFQNA